MLQGTQVGIAAGVASRSHSVRVYGSFNFSQPSKRDTNLNKEHNNQPGYTEQRRRPERQGDWRQHEQRQQWHKSNQQSRQQQRPRQRNSDEASHLSRFEHQYLVTCHPGLEKVSCNKTVSPTRVGATHVAAISAAKQQLCTCLDNTKNLVRCNHSHTTSLAQVTAADLQQCCQQAGAAAEVAVTAPGRISVG